MRLKFPVNFGPKSGLTRCNSGDFRLLLAKFKPGKRKNSLFFRISGLLKSRDRLARDCLHHQPVSQTGRKISFSAALEIRPVFRVLGEGRIGLSLSRDAIGARCRASPARRLSRPLSAQAVGGRSGDAQALSAWWKPRNWRWPAQSSGRSFDSRISRCGPRSVGPRPARTSSMIDGAR